MDEFFQSCDHLRPAPARHWSESQHVGQPDTVDGESDSGGGPWGNAVPVEPGLPIGIAFTQGLQRLGAISVGTDVLLVWNWSFLPLDLLAVTAGLTWSLLPTGHRWSTPLFLCALTLTFSAGLLAVSFFALWGAWTLSWWLVNLWLMLMPAGLFLTPRLPCRGTASP